MGRIDAEHRSSPLHPRKLTTGPEAPALPLGQNFDQHTTRRRRVQRQEPQIPIEIREPVNAFRTGYEGLISSVRGQLEERRHYLPAHRLPLTVGPDQHIHVAIASGNDIKIQEIQELTERHVRKSDVIRVPDADEIHEKLTDVDALSKAIDAARIIASSGREMTHNEPLVAVASDVLNRIPTVVARGSRRTGLKEIAFKPVGKPNAETMKSDDPEVNRQVMLKRVQRMFGGMASLAEKQDWDTIPYIAEMATVIHNPADPKDTAISIQRSAIFLDPKRIAYIATPQGFAEYVEIARTHRVDVTKTAGGFALEALQEMGCVRFITGTEAELGEEMTRSRTFPAQRPQAVEHAQRITSGRIDRWLFEDYFRGRVDRARRQQG